MKTLKFSKPQILFFPMFLFSAFLFAQSMPDMPSMPEVSAPTIGGGFYTPEIPGYPRQGTSPKSQGSSASTEQVLSAGNTTTNDVISNVLSNTDFLTASDLNSLSDLGLFSNLSVLSGNNSKNASSQNLMLKQILASLENIQKNQEAAAGKNSSADKKQSDSSVFKEREPAILRFKINGYDMLDSITQVFFSRLESDGTFLLTADRRYVADRKNRTETFYLLFKTSEGRGHTINYTVEPAIMQDSKYENSYIYKFTSLKNLTATKTGNLVVLRSDGRDLKVDLLLDVDN